MKIGYIVAQLKQQVITNLVISLVLKILTEVNLNNLSSHNPIYVRTNLKNMNIFQENNFELNSKSVSKTHLQSHSKADSAYVQCQEILEYVR